MSSGASTARVPRRRADSVSFVKTRRDGVPMTIVIAGGIACFAFGLLVSRGTPGDDLRSGRAPAELSAPVAKPPALPVPSEAFALAPSADGALASAATPEASGERHAAGAASVDPAGGSNAAAPSAPPVPSGAAEILAAAVPTRSVRADELGEADRAVMTDGWLKLAAEPSVLVYEGERKLGKTPLEIRMPAGPHDLRLVDRERFVDERLRVTIRAGSQVARELEFALGGLRVEAPDGAKLYLDRRPMGEAPFERRILLSEGTHHLRLEIGDETIEEKIEIPAGQTVDYRLRL